MVVDDRERSGASLEYASEELGNVDSCRCAIAAPDAQPLNQLEAPAQGSEPHFFVIEVPERAAPPTGQPLGRIEPNGAGGLCKARRP